MPPKLTAADTSVIVVTLNRPDCMQKCLECLYAQTEKAGQIIVVDGSADNLTREVCSKFPEVIYLRNDNGLGHMTQSRNIGLNVSTGQVVAFIDDDAFAEPEWLVNLLSGYVDETVGAVGGRALNNQPNEATIGVDDIGQLKKDGTLAGFFAADPGRIIEVDHIIGCSMSFRREVLAQLGGFREDFPGNYSLCEDTDMCLRVRRIGFRILFVPSSVCLHIGAPQVKSKRFDVQWTYNQSRNYACMLIRNYGLFSPLFGSHFVHLVGRSVATFAKKFGGAFAYLLAPLFGIIVGIFCGIQLVLKVGYSPIRTDADGQELTQKLSSPASNAKSLADEHTLLSVK